jgi:nitroreductase
MTQLNARIADPASVDAAILNRYCVRAFSAQPVPRASVNEILQVARYAPSGSNAQPWRVYVLQGRAREALVTQVCAAYDAIRDRPDLAARYQEEYDYYPRHWEEPYLGRRRRNGWGLYGLLGIGRADKDKMHAQHRRNFEFFDAPVGLIFTVDRIMGAGSLIDYGMFLQNIMVAARARGLHTCPQAAWNRFHSIIMPFVGASADEKLVCGMSLGWPDESAPVNTFSNARAPVESFTRWVGDAGEPQSAR